MNTFEGEDWEVDFPPLADSCLVEEAYSSKGQLISQRKFELGSEPKKADALLRKKFEEVKKNSAFFFEIGFEFYIESPTMRVKLARYEAGKMVEYQHPPWRNMVF